MTAVKTIIDSVVGQYPRKEVFGDGTVVWTDQQDRFHRIDGPAIVYSTGGECWYKHGIPHRVDGPASTSPYGPDEYWVHGHKLTIDDFYRYVDQETGEVFMPPGKRLVNWASESVETEVQSLYPLGVRQVDRVDAGEYTMILLHNIDDWTYEVALTSAEQDFTTAQSQEKRPPTVKSTNKKDTLKTLVRKLEAWVNAHSPIGVGTMNKGRSKKYHALLRRLGFTVGPIEHTHDPQGPFKDYWTFMVS
jgi:hypothetical protein